MLCKKSYSEKLRKVYWKTVSFFNHVAGCKPAKLFFKIIKKETLETMFYCEIWEIFQNGFSLEHLWHTAPEGSSKCSSICMTFYYKGITHWYICIYIYFFYIYIYILPYIYIYIYGNMYIYIYIYKWILEIYIYIYIHI